MVLVIAVFPLSLFSGAKGLPEAFKSANPALFSVKIDFCCPRLVAGFPKNSGNARLVAGIQLRVPIVLLSCHQPQVSKAIVVLYPVYVVNDLSIAQFNTSLYCIRRAMGLHPMA